MSDTQHTWVILLRGINVGGVKVLMTELSNMLEGLGMTQVKTLLASGNVIADAPIAEAKEVKRVVEVALAETFGRPLTVVIRPLSAIEAMVAENPFADVAVTPEMRLNVSFLGESAREGVAVPYTPDDGAFSILDQRDGALFSVFDVTRSGTLDVMGFIEKTWGKDVTTRTWKTIEKIAAARA